MNTSDQKPLEPLNKESRELKVGDPVYAPDGILECPDSNVATTRYQVVRGKITECLGSNLTEEEELYMGHS